MEILKRNGKMEKYDIQKIKNVIEICSNQITDFYPFDDLLSARMSIESNINSSKAFKSTEEIQKMLIKICEKLHIEMKNEIFQNLGAQLKLYNIKKHHLKKLGLLNNENQLTLKKHIEYFIEKNLYMKKHLGYWSDVEIEKIQHMMNNDYDKNFTLSQINLLSKKYLIRDDVEAYEPPQFLNIIQSMCLAKNIPNRLEYVEKFYEAIASNKVSLATPIRANLRRFENLTSCFIIECDDNSESILKGMKKAALYSKNGGGVGIYLGKIRPSNAKIKNFRGANNIVKWVKIFDCIAPAWNQNGIRNGAFTVSLDIWHKDILSFIYMKTESGGDVNEKCFNVFPQIIINRQFINEVKNDGLFPLLDRKEILDIENIDIANIKEYNEHYDTIKKNIIDGKYENCSTISAKVLWKEILKTYIETGELFLAHKDNINKTNPLAEYGLYINSTNLCTESFSPAVPSYSNKKSIDHSCNLISLNMNEITFNEIQKWCSIAVEILNSSVDISKSIFKSSKRSKTLINPIGVGVMGIADYLQKNNLKYSNVVEIEKIFESIAYYALKKSNELAKINGSFELFEHSDFAIGKFLGKTGDELQQSSICGYDWKQLLEDVKRYGCKNAMLISVAPNTSTSILCGSSPNYIPIIKHVQIETTNSDNFVFQKTNNYELYENVGVENIIKLTNDITKWIDSGISMELIISNNDNIKKISDCLIEAFSNNLKTLYYCRVIENENKQQKFHCVGCEN